MSALTGSHPARAARLRLALEESYAALPASPDWHTLPLARTREGLHRALTFYAADAPVSIAPCYAPDGTVHVAGQFACAGLPAAAELLLGLALDRTAGGELPSWTAEAYHPDDPRRLDGLVVRELQWTATPAGSVLTVEALGRTETERPGLVPADFADPAADRLACALRAAAITADDTALPGVRELMLRVRNEVRPGPADASGVPAWMSAGRREVSVALRYYATDGALRGLARTGTSFALQASLPGAAGRTVSVQCPAARCRHVQDVPGLDGPAERHAELVATPDTAGTDITWNTSP